MPVPQQGKERRSTKGPPELGQQEALLAWNIAPTSDIRGPADNDYCLKDNTLSVWIYFPGNLPLRPY
jgi:hypothetical protein